MVAEHRLHEFVDRGAPNGSSLEILCLLSAVHASLFQGVDAEDDLVVNLRGAEFEQLPKL